MNVREILLTRGRVNKLVGTIAGVVLCSLVIVLASCGGGGGQTEFMPTEEDSVREVISGLPGAASDPQEFRAMFVEGAAPAESERQKYGPYMCRANSLKIDGATATATVEVEDGNTGEIVGEVEWTLARQGEQWKLQSAPLP